MDVDPVAFGNVRELPEQQVLYRREVIVNFIYLQTAQTMLEQSKRQH